MEANKRQRAQEAAQFRSSPRWIVPVTGLRIALCGATAALGGLPVRLASTVIGLWLLGAGMCVYLCGVAVILFGYWLVNQSIEPPAPSFWRFLWTLVGDVFRRHQP